MTIIFENVNGMAAVGIGIGLMTVVGQSIGAGRQEEAKYYIVKLAGYAEVAMIISCILVYIAARPVTVLALSLIHICAGFGVGTVVAFVIIVAFIYLLFRPYKESKTL